MLGEHFKHSFIYFIKLCINMSDKRSILRSILDRLGNFSMTTLADRIIFQKSIFILKSIGLDLGYEFSLWRYGPYSSELASDGFLLSELGWAKETTPLNLKEEDIIYKFKKLTNGHERDTTFFELISTFLYFKNLHQSKNDIELFNLVIEKKPYLDSKDLFNEMIKKLKEENLI